MKVSLAASVQGNGQSWREKDSQLSKKMRTSIASLSSLRGCRSMRETLLKNLFYSVTAEKEPGQQAEHCNADQAVQFWWKLESKFV